MTKFLILLLVFLSSPVFANPLYLLAGSSGTGAATIAIQDDFSTNTAANYTNIGAPGLVISGGTAGTSAWAVAPVYHTTQLSSSNHYAEAKLSINGIDKTGLIVRCSGTGGTSTGYIVKLNTSTALRLTSFLGTAETYVADFPAVPALTSGALYSVKVTAADNVFHAFIDLNNDGDYLDAGEDLGTKTSSTYTNGQHVGLLISRSGANNDVRVDDLIGDSL